MLERLYRALLLLYPPAFRRRYGRQMRDDFQEMRERGAPVGAAFLDLVRTVPQRWLEVLRDFLSVGPPEAPAPLERLGDLARAVGRALRALARRPGFTLVVVGSLAVGIGAGTAVFSWTEGLVLRPLPAVDRLADLVTIEVREPARANEEPVVSFPDFQRLQEGLGHVAPLAGFGLRPFHVSRTREPQAGSGERLWGAFVTREYFSLLGIEPVKGRLLQESDDGAGAPEQAAFISEALWTRLFGRDPGVVGRRLSVEGGEFEIRGVVPGEFTGTIVGLRLDLWLPVRTAAAVRSDPGLLDDGSRRWLRVFGRVSPGISRATADREVRRVWKRLEAEEVVDDALEARAVAFDVGLAARLKPLLVILLSLSGFMLLVVCTNVANLTLMKGAAHDHELAVMRALGADRARVAAAVLTESILLGVLGVLVGLGVALLGSRLLQAVLPPTPLPLELEAPMDLRVFGFLAALGLAAALASGAVPALRAMRSDPIHALKARRGRSGRSAIQHSSLIVAQLALSLGTLAAAGFFLDRLDRLEAVEPGFRDPEGVVLFPTDLAEADARTAWRSGRLHDLVRSVRDLPGVRSAAVASFVPLGFVGYASLEVDVPSGDASSGAPPLRYLVNRVGEGYFELMGTSIVAGRPIDASDGPESGVVAVVNETFAQRHWPGLDPIGRGFLLGGREAVVVGVAVDGKYRFDQLDEPSEPFLYVAWAQWPSTSLILHVRVEEADAPDPRAVRLTFEGSFPRARLTGPMALDEYTGVALVPVRLGASVLGGLGTLAMILAAVGLYAIMAFRVRQRTREVGVRLAVGAGGGRILGMFIGQGAGIAAVGMALGLPFVLAIYRIFAMLIPGLRPGWQVVYLSAAAAIFAVALAAVTLAARGALSISPTEALRAE